MERGKKYEITFPAGFTSEFVVFAFTERMVIILMILIIKIIR